MRKKKNKLTTEDKLHFVLALALGFAIYVVGFITGGLIK